MNHTQSRLHRPPFRPLPSRLLTLPSDTRFPHEENFMRDDTPRENMHLHCESQVIHKKSGKCVRAVLFHWR